MLLCDGFQESYRCQESCCLFRFGARKSRASNNFCHERINICLCSRSCWCCQLIGHSCSNPVYIDHQYGREHICLGQAVTTVMREQFSSQFPFSHRVRSMNSVSFAMLRAEIARVYQTRQTLCWEERFLSDAAVATSYQESRCLFQTGARKRRASNNFCP